MVYNPFYEFANVIGSYFMGMGHLHDDFVYLHADTICDVGIRDRVFSSYFEGALQRVFDMKKYDVKMIETAGRFWGEIDFLEDYQKVENNISSELLFI